MRFHAAYALVLVMLLAAPLNAQTLANALVPAWNQSIGGYSEQVETNIIFMGVDDINNDGFGEIVAVVGSSITSSADSAEENRVYAFSENGTLLWSRGFTSEINSAMLLDVDRDGQIEVLVGTGQEIQKITRGTVEVIRSDGTRDNTIKFNAIVKSLTASDFEGDRYPELVATSRNTVYVFGPMGSPIWEYSLRQTPPTDPSVVVTDFIDNPLMEVIVGGYDIRILNHSGIMDYPILSVESVTGKNSDKVDVLAVGDILATGGKQIVFSTRASDNLYVYGLEKQKDGKEMIFVEKWVYALDGKITALKLYDVDGDGLEEILFADENEMMYLLETNGRVKWSFKVYGRITDIEIADINNDLNPEVLIASTSGSIQVLDLADGSLVWDHTLGEPIRWLSINKLDLDDIKEVVVGTMYRNIHVFSVNESFTEIFEANSYYELGQKYFVEGNYDESMKYLLKAKGIYMRYDTRGDILKVNELISNIKTILSQERRQAADTFYDKAVQFFIEEDYIQSKQFAQDSKSIYEEFGDTRNALKAELLIIRINDRIEKLGKPTTSIIQNHTSVEVQGKKGGGMTSVILFVLVLVITIILLNVAVKRKKAASTTESAEVQAYENRLEKVLDEDMDELSKGA